MAIITWIGGHAGAPNSWEDRFNWTGGTGTIPATPADGDDVVVAHAANEPSITTSTASLNSLTVNPGANLAIGAFTFIAQTVTNAGTITTNSSGASGVQMFSAVGTVTNSGTIAGDVAGAGVLLQAGGLLTNSASGVIEGGIDGLLSRGAVGTVTNDGTIRSTGSSTGTGVLFTDKPGVVVDNSLINSGTIIGKSAAVQFAAGNDLLKLLPGASFTGLVDGGAGTNTLELAVGAGAGRMTGLGTSFTNFGTLLFDAGAQWTVAGIAHGDLGTMAIAGLTALDTIDLTDFNFGAATWTFANNTLVLTNGAAQETLHIQGDFSAGNFSISSDGAGGTNIVAVPTAKPTIPGEPTLTPGSSLTVLDTTTNELIAATGENYAGPVPGLQHEYIINTSPHNLNVTASTPNWFIHTGSGDDAIAVSSGTNVLDGGTGSNFLTGGSGTDTFFVDDRLPTADIWSTVVGFHSGDDATIFGITPSDFKLTWLDNQGAAGAKGLTGGFTASGKPTANITLAGYSTADLGSKLLVTYGKTLDTPGLPGSVYMNIHGV